MAERATTLEEKRHSILLAAGVIHGPIIAPDLPIGSRETGYYDLKTKTWSEPESNDLWIQEYMAWHGYDLIHRLARAIYPTCVWTHCRVGPATAWIWAEKMVAALRHGRDL